MISVNKLTEFIKNHAFYYNNRQFKSSFQYSTLLPVLPVLYATWSSRKPKNRALFSGLHIQ